MATAVQTQDAKLAGVAHVRQVLALLVATILIALLAFAYNPSTACAAEPASSEAAAQVEQTADASDESASDQEAAEETIEDEDVPMADGSTMKRSALANLHWFVVAGIVVVGGFFLVSTGRLNRNIKKMEHFIK